MWRKHRSIFQDHLKYIWNGIVKPFRVVILCYSERVQNMHGPGKYLFSPLMKGKSFDETSWKVSDKELSEHEIIVAFKYGLP